MFFFACWIAFSLIPATIASKKGRSGIGWFFLSLLISPLLAGIIVACLPPLEANVEAAAVERGAMKKCPYCAEIIKSEAILCRYCGKDQKSAYSEPFPKLADGEGPKVVGGIVIKE